MTADAADFEPASDDVALAKFILTVEVGPEQLDDVDEALREAAEALNARLTRADYAVAKSSRFLVRLRRTTIRKLGRLS